MCYVCWKKDLVRCGQCVEIISLVLTCIVRGLCTVLLRCRVTVPCRKLVMVANLGEFQSPKTKLAKWSTFATEQTPQPKVKWCTFHESAYTPHASVDIKIEKRFSFTLYHLVLLSNCPIVHILNHRLIVLC